jgi:hypothetical protein
MRVVNVLAPFVADGEAPEAGHPGQGPLHFPAVSPEPAAVLNAAPGDARDDAAAAAVAPAEAVVVALVGVQLVGAPTRPAAGPAAAADRRDGIEGGGQHLAVVAVGRTQGQAEWGAVAIDGDIPFGVRLAAVRRVRAGRRSRLLPEQTRRPARPCSSRACLRRAAVPATRGASEPTPPPPASPVTAASRSYRTRSPSRRAGLPTG